MLAVAGDAVVAPLGVKYTELLPVVIVVPAGMGLPFTSVKVKLKLLEHDEAILTVVGVM